LSPFLKFYLGEFHWSIFLTDQMGNSPDDDVDDFERIDLEKHFERKMWLKQTNFQRQKTLEDTNFLHFLFKKYLEEGEEVMNVKERGKHLEPLKKRLFL
jgi:hypothetical protein